MNMRRLLTAALLISGTVGVAQAQFVAVDFDTDNDPATVESVISAQVGEIVDAWIVFNTLPYPYTSAGGVQLALVSTPGLDFIGFGDTGAGAVLHDGNSIAVAFPDPLPLADMPMFAVRAFFEVLSEGAQEVRVGASQGWDNPLPGLAYLVYDEDGEDTLIYSLAALRNQRPGEVHVGTVPVVNRSWSAVKRLFSDDTL